MENFIARQPVLDSSKSVFGYELLFRDGLDNCCRAKDGDLATKEVLATTLFDSPFHEMVGGKRGLINFTQNLLVGGFPYLFEKDHTVIEVLETVQPDDAVIAACRKLKQAGYTIALDDFLASDLHHPLLKLANIVKVDFKGVQGKNRKTVAENLRSRGLTLLAEKVETHADFREGMDLGYELFQGYFFSKPLVQTIHRTAPAAVACLRMLQVIAEEDFTFEDLNEIVKSDVSISYRILRLVNSPLFSFRPNINSTLHALTLLGRNHIRRFMSILAVNVLGAQKPSELVQTSVIRARLAEQIAAPAGFSTRTSEFFLAGLFSLIDALMDRPMHDLMSDLPVCADVKTALLGGENPIRRTLDMIVAYETANWPGLETSAASLGLDPNILPRLYTSSLTWGRTTANLC